MLSAPPPLTVRQASHYYRSEFSRGDYYTERESEGRQAWKTDPPSGAGN